jgi:hypothetical protein
MQESILTRAKREYPSGTIFISASGLLKSPMRVSSLKISENYKGVIHNSEGGIIYDGHGRWAIKV